MYTDQIIKPAKDIIEEVAGLISQGIECWQKAGELVVRLLDDHGMTTAEIAGSSPYLTQSIISRFEQLGRKQIVPRLLVADFPAAKHVIRLTYSEQKRVLDSPVELLTLEESTTDKLAVSVENLTHQQCKQVFGTNYVRTLGAQRAYLEEQKTKTPVLLVEPLYKIRGKRVVFTQPCEMTARQLAQILAEVEP
jgi:hypothetical protein